MTKKTIHKLFYDYKTKSFIITNDVLAFFTIISVLGVILETVKSLGDYRVWFLLIEYVSVAFFTLEYIARIWVSEKKLDYIFSFYGVIDFFAIFPTFLGLSNLTFLKSVRILRIMRFLRMIRLAKVIRLKRTKSKDLEEYTKLYRLNIQIYFFTLFSAIVIFASLIYVFEYRNIEFANIPLSMLWSAKVLLGGIYQDVPHTLWGNLVIIATRFVGLILFGLLINVVGTAVKRMVYGGHDNELLDMEEKILNNLKTK
mgnify:CR=1 FL=1